MIIVLVPICVLAQDKKTRKSESFVLAWPVSENWVVGDDQETTQQHVVDYIHDNESVDAWTELGNMTTINRVIRMHIDTVMYIMFSSAKATAPDAKLTLLEQGEKQDCQWIIFTIEAPRFNDNENPESQIWYIIQGKQALYTNFVAVKKALLDEGFKTKWSSFFRKGLLVYK